MKRQTITTIAEMVKQVQAKTGVGRRKARDLISDSAESLDLASDGMEQYSEDDVVEIAVKIHVEGHP